MRATRENNITAIDSRTGNYFKLIVGVLAISFSPLAVKLVTFMPGLSAFYRSLYAACFFLVFALAEGALRKGANAGRGDLRWVMPSVLAGVFLGIDLFIWHKTILYVGAGPATFLGTSQILFVTVFAAFVFKERISKLFYLILAMVIVGLYLLIPIAATGVSRPVGYALGIVVGLTYAGMLICLRYAKTLSGKPYPELASLAVTFFASASVILVLVLSFEGTSVLAGGLKDHAIMAVTALLCQTFGWYMIHSSILKLPAHEGSLLLMLQPLLAMVWGCLLFREPFSAVQGLGIILVLAGIIWYQNAGKPDGIEREIEAEEMI